MKQFKNPVYIAIILAMTLAFMFSLSTMGQIKAKRVGNTFVQCDSLRQKKSEAKKTEYVYIDKKGVRYDVYVSKNGKYFILRTSKKSGKQYQQYIKEVKE